jgi:hypothetical protein
VAEEGGVISTWDAATSCNPADIVFSDGKVYTVNEAQPWAEAVAVAGNKIV